MSQDYRIDLRNVLNRRYNFATVGKDLGLGPKLLEDLLNQRSHILVDMLQRLVGNLGGELRI